MHITYINLLYIWVIQLEEDEEKNVAFTDMDDFPEIEKDISDKLWKEVAMRAESEKRHIENELMRLKNENRQLKEELKRLKSHPMVVGEIRDILINGKVVVKSSTGPHFVVGVARWVDKESLEVGVQVALHKDTLVVMDVIPPSTDPAIKAAELIERPAITYESIGGLTEQIEELKEVIELPLTSPELFEKVGIDPPVGVILVGPPGTGKTLLAKAVAHHTNASFIRLVGSELVQKFIGEGARLVRELFELAEEKKPSIIFLDELDAIAARRIDTGTSADREVQRTLIQLLAELDGFDTHKEVSVIAATNRVDIVDPALLRPGRFDRIVEVPLPTEEGRREIFKIHTRNMNLSDNMDMEELARKSKDYSGADIKAVCTEAGMLAIRGEKDTVNMDDFNDAMKKIEHEKEGSIGLNRIGDSGKVGMFA